MSTTTAANKDHTRFGRTIKVTYTQNKTHVLSMPEHITSYTFSTLKPLEPETPSSFRHDLEGSHRVIYIPNKPSILTAKSVLKGKNANTTFEFEWSPYMDILDEQTALADAPLTDIKKAVDVHKSKLYLLDKKDSYEVGDIIKIRADLFDGRSNQRQRGGDQLRVRIFEKSLGASSAGYVVDHKNGSYTAMLRCLWTGSQTVIVYISYTREAVRALYHTRQVLSSTRDTYAVYKNNEYKKCHAFTTQLNKSAAVCNMTSINGNMPWYCEAPTSSNSSCSEFTVFSLKPPFPALPVTYAERVLLSMRNGEHMMPTLRIIVNEKNTQTTDVTRTSTCFSFNRTQLWFQASPIGHFMRGKWYTDHCEMPPVNKFSQCLRNKHVFLYGDSTIRQWFQDLQKRFNCTLTSEQWTRKKWKKDSAAFCPSLNLTIEWIAHSIPGNVDKTSHSVQPFDEIMIRFAKQKNVVFVIHLLCHLSAFHHNVFKDRMLRISQSVKTVLKINKDAQILIKGGHTFRDFTQVSDYYGYVYRVITLELFKGVYDKVVYLDNKDMTIAEEVLPNHPNENIVSQMVNQMLSYICV